MNQVNFLVGRIVSIYRCEAKVKVALFVVIVDSKEVFESIVEIKMELLGNGTHR